MTLNALLAAVAISNQTAATPDPTQLALLSGSPHHHTRLIDSNSPLLAATIGTRYVEQQDSFSSVLRAKNGYSFAIEFGLLDDVKAITSIMDGASADPDMRALTFLRNLDALVAFCEMNPEFAAKFKTMSSLQVVFFDNEADLERFMGKEAWKSQNLTPSSCFMMGKVASDDKPSSYGIFIKRESIQEAPIALNVPFAAQVATIVELQDISPKQLSVAAQNNAAKKAIAVVEKILAETNKTTPPSMKINEKTSIEFTKAQMVFMRKQLDEFKQALGI